MDKTVDNPKITHINLWDMCGLSCGICGLRVDKVDVAELQGGKVAGWHVSLPTLPLCNFAAPHHSVAHLMVVVHNTNDERQLFR